MHLDPVAPGAAVSLSDEAARPSHMHDADKSALRDRLDTLTERIDRLQEALFAESERSVLVVLQGRDTSGKDGTIRKVFGPLDPQGTVVTAFKAPTELELRHDFLWRVHQAVPPRGLIGIFNRSHYEDVLVVRVRQLVPERVWRGRYEQINRFERNLVESGTTILKFFLHISRAEQRERLLARLEEPEKFWKFNPGDLEDRKRWDDYTAAAEEMLARTSTETAPWYVVPADHKPIRDVLVAETIVAALERMDPKYPAPTGDLAAWRRELA
ncbi:MAG TPA: PPK2 family polyphosphate kinase [Gemmatimonadales bacterium]|nr:PPK2 family polyphosphate kinase [Gemmatimonadales bacterium]